MKKILLPIETSVRELPGRIEIAKEILNLKNFEVVICSRNYAFKSCLFNNPNFILNKGMSIEQLWLYQYCIFKGIKLGLLHAEGGIFYEDNSLSLKSIYRNEYVELININFVWGEKILRDIKKLKLNIFKKSVVSGDPRFSRTILKNTDEEFILINTSFSIVNPSAGDKKLEKFINQDKSLTYTAKQKLHQKKQFFKNVFNDFLEMIEYISKNSTSKIIIRPHPSENISTYINKFKSKKNITVSNSKPIEDLLPSAKLVVHYDCTTGLEALLKGKMTISYSKLHNNEVVAYLPRKFSKIVSNKFDLLQIIKNPSAYNYNINDQIESLKEHLGPLDSKISSKIIAKNIIEIIKMRDTRKLRLSSKIHSIFLKNLFVIKIFFSLFIKSYYSRRKKTRMSDVKFKKFNKDDIDILSKKHNINIELINEEAICVKR